MTESQKKRTAQIDADRFWVGVLAIVLVTIIMTASYVFSFAAIAEAGGWTGASLQIAWLAAVFVDGPILTYTISLVVKERRGESRAGLRLTRIFLYAFTATSVALNFAHTGSYWKWDYTSTEAWFGSLMAVAAPLAALAASEEVVRLAFAKSKSEPVDPAAEPAPEPAVESVPEPAAELEPEVARDTADVPDDEPFDAGLSALDHELSELIHPSDYTIAIEAGNEVGADVHDAHRG